jgi:hypothetical protein
MSAEIIPIKSSSHVQGVSYDEDTQELVVSFAKASYLYSGVPPQVANGFAGAASAGQYLDTAIKAAEYPYKKL